MEFDGEAEKVDATFQATDSDMFDLLSGKLNPQRAFLTVSLLHCASPELSIVIGSLSAEGQDHR